VQQQRQHGDGLKMCNRLIPTTAVLATATAVTVVVVVVVVLLTVLMVMMKRSQRLIQTSMGRVNKQRVTMKALVTRGLTIYRRPIRGTAVTLAPTTDAV
jgi:hypothetical protein